MRKHRHLARFHTKGHADLLLKPILGRRAHGLLSEVHGLTPIQTANLKKRIAAGVYANQWGRVSP